MEAKAGDPTRGARSRKPYRILSISVNPYCELVRWLLERASVPYHEQCSAPVLHLLTNEVSGGSQAVPVLISSEATLINAHQALEYIDLRLPRDLQLYPGNAADRVETDRLLLLFLDKLGKAVRSFCYSYLLPQKDLLIPVITHGVPPWQKLVVVCCYPLMRSTMERALPAGVTLAESFKKEIELVFSEVSLLLNEGRHYLLGDRISIADYCFAAMAAPILYPNRYGSPLPPYERIPEAMRKFSADLRNTPAGEFALKLYQDHRSAPQPVLTHHPASTMPENTLSYWKSRLIAVLTGARVQRFAFALLRKHKPVLVFGKRAVITRDADAREALAEILN